jgi:hypothetical protein
MAENRLDRKLETREKSTRKRSWRRPEVLPTPDAQDGYSYHWVRVATRGQADPTNVTSKLREGWEPVKASDHPEIELAVVENERFKDNVVIGGLMLCKAPEELVEERTEYYGDQTSNQMRSVDNNLMRESDPRMPMFNDRRSKVTFGKGN